MKLQKRLCFYFQRLIMYGVKLYKIYFYYFALKTKAQCALLDFYFLVLVKLSEMLLFKFNIKCICFSHIVHVFIYINYD